MENKVIQFLYFLLYLSLLLLLICFLFVRNNHFYRFLLLWLRVLEEDYSLFIFLHWLRLIPTIRAVYERLSFWINFLKSKQLMVLIVWILLGIFLLVHFKLRQAHLVIPFKRFVPFAFIWLRANALFFFILFRSNP